MDTDLFDKIRAWADTRGILAPEGVNRQVVKLLEELGETVKAIIQDDKPEIIDRPIVTGKQIGRAHV